uniref:Uncharacterized protein n=1 Tax=viral metagenome TaxID=1070528 RepID=A0A6M3JXM2_9ZZZZ
MTEAETNKMKALEKRVEVLEAALAELKRLATARPAKGGKAAEPSQ